MFLVLQKSYYFNHERRDKMGGMGKALIILGMLLIIIGLFLNLSGKIPFLGKLPGDIYFKKGNFSFYFPITTCIIISIVLTLLFSIFKK